MTMASQFRVVPCVAANGVRLRCSGEVDLSNVHLLRESLREHLAEASPELAVDLGEVTYLDSAAVNELLQAAKALIRQGRRLRVNVTLRQYKLFLLTGCDRLLVLETT